YVACAGEDAILSIRVAADGRLGRWTRTPAAGRSPCSCAVVPGGYLATANYLAGTVSLHALDRTGLLGAPADVAQVPRRPPGPVRERQPGPRPHQVRIGPGGEVLVCDLGGDAVWSYEVRRGRLRLAGRLDLPPGTGPRNLAPSAGPPGAAAAVVAGELAGTAVGVDLRARRVHSPPLAVGPGSGQPAGIAAGPAATYVADRASDTVTAFRWEHGTLRRTADLAVAAFPLSLAVAGYDGQDHLVVASRDAGVVSGHAIGADGAPDPRPSFRVAVPGVIAVSAYRP
ncbi:lactonase family protein, partial [Jiangella alba]